LAQTNPIPGTAFSSPANITCQCCSLGRSTYIHGLSSIIRIIEPPSILLEKIIGSVVFLTYVFLKTT